MASPNQLTVRRAVREVLTDLNPARAVLVACSGGADSLALAAALGQVASRDGRPAGGVIVDHGLQPGSAERARHTAGVVVGFGLDPVEVVHVRVVQRGQGPEGDARSARYAALDAAADRHGASAILLGHTRDDQAESVLLGLARGSGARSLAGMAPTFGRYRRPFLGLSRETVRSTIPADVKPWEDPHNADPAFARARVRQRVLPVLEDELGPGVTEALSRTAGLLSADADALDAWAERAFTECVRRHPLADQGRSEADKPHVTRNDGDQQIAEGVVLDVQQLAELPRAVRTRVLRQAAITAGSPRTDLTADHVAAVEALITRWRGQRGVDLPGPVRAARSGSELRIGPLR